MAFVFGDRVKETTTTTGTGNITLAGAATGFRTFSSVVSSGNTTAYAIVDATGAQWEIGYGTMSGSTTLIRSQVFSSSSGGSAVNFSAGTKSVFITLPATMGGTVIFPGLSATLYDPINVAYGVAIGNGVSIDGNSAVAIGNGARAEDSHTIAIGYNATAGLFGAERSIAIGYQTSVQVDSIAIGTSTSANGGTAVSIGYQVGSPSSYTINLGNNISSTYLDYGIAIGSNVSTTGSSSGYGGVVIGKSSQITSNGTYGSIAIGGSVTSGSDAVAMGHNNVAGTASIFIGNANTDSAAGGNVVIGNSITVPSVPSPVTGATFMNKIRTGVTPAGTAWTLKWDDATKEVYGDPGGGPTGANWYSYQSDDFTSATLSLALPSGTPTSTPGPGSQIWYGTNSGSKTLGFPWSSYGSSGPFFSGVYSNMSYPITDPITNGGPPGSGLALCYFAGYATDAGTFSTQAVYTGTSLYSNFGSSVNVSGFSFFGGPSTAGHGVAIVSGNVVGLVTASGPSPVTIVEDFYDSYGNYTYVFFDADQSATSWMSSGSSFLNLPGSTGYYVIFWYNY